MADQIEELRLVGGRGLMVEVAGPIHMMSVGGRVVIETGNSPVVPCEVVGFSGAHALFDAVAAALKACAAAVAQS